MSEIRLLLIDDQLLMRESMSRLLAAEPDMRVALEVEKIDEALAALREQTVDIALLGAEVACAVGPMLAAACPGLRYLALARNADAVVARAALRAGASGVALRHTTVAALLRAIRQVAAGDVWLDAQLIPALLEVDPNGSARAFADGLTSREKAVLDALMQGLSNRHIGERLGVSEGAVKAALHRIFRREGVRTRGQLVRRVVETAREKSS